MVEWRYRFIILNLGTRWRWVVSFTPRPLYSRRSPLYLLDRSLGGPKSRPQRCAEKKNLASAGNRTPAVQPVSRRYTDWATPVLYSCSVLLFSLAVRDCFSALFNRLTVLTLWSYYSELCNHWVRVVPLLHAALCTSVEMKVSGRYWNAGGREVPTHVCRFPVYRLVT
jgi:hypothetical protein